VCYNNDPWSCGLPISLKKRDRQTDGYGRTHKGRSSLTLEREERRKTEHCPYYDGRQTSEPLGFDRGSGLFEARIVHTRFSGHTVSVFLEPFKTNLATVFFCL
jgi:hypothetical protein